MAVSIGIVGGGGIGETHAHLLQEMESASLDAVCDLDRGKATDLANAVGARAYTDHAELLHGEDVDAVYLTTPPGTRVEIVRQVARENAAIFCEKPLATTVEEGREIAEVVEERGIPFMMGFCLRFCEPCIRLHDLLAAGRLGDPITLFSARGGRGVPGEGNWRVDPEQACGITVESASHNIDLLRWLGGSVASASGATANVSHPELEDFDDNVVATLAFETDAIGCLRNSWTSHVEYLRHGVVGTEGAAVVEGRGWWRLDRLTYATEGDRHRTTIEFDPETATDMGYRGETEAFVEALIEGEDPPVGVRDGLRALEISRDILG